MRFDDIETGSGRSWFDPDNLANVYGEVIRDYLQALLGNDLDLQEVNQWLHVRIAQGDFSHWQAIRGGARFRKFLKKHVFWAAMEYKRLLRKERKRRATLPEVFPDLSTVEPAIGPEDGQYRAGYLTALVRLALRKLKDYETRTPRSDAYKLIKKQLAGADGPVGTESLCRFLCEETGNQKSPEAVRTALHRARKQFARLLVDVVRETLAEPTAENLKDELNELGLIFLLGSTNTPPSKD
jgi:hypothetical protein